MAVLTRPSDPVQVIAGSNLTILKVNDPPIAEAGPPQEHEVGTVFRLDGSQSSDLDEDALSYSWSLTSIPNGSQLTDADILDRETAFPSLTPDQRGDYILTLTVNDGEATDTDTVNLTAIVSNEPPVADAGPDQALTLGEEATLDGPKQS